MPIWFELVFLLLITYALGLGLGWIMWGRALSPVSALDPSSASTIDTQQDDDIS